MVDSGSIEPSIHLLPMDGLENRLKDDGGMPQHVVIPEPQHTESFRSEEGVATPVVGGLFDMLTAVELDDHLRLDTGEIADVGPNGILATELEATQLSAPQPMP